MTLVADLALAERGLDALEAVEARGLVWGLVDGVLEDQDVADVLRDVLDHQDSRTHLDDPDCTIRTMLDLRQKLVDLEMLFQIPGPDDQIRGWRTRMAEGVRLTAQLRQLFGKHRANDAWATAPTLVADFRFLRRPRKYPRRDLLASDVRSMASDVITDTALLSALEYWLDQMGPRQGLSRFQVDATLRVLKCLQSNVRTGTLVSAGTGSGKTLAFYLPALSWIASNSAQCSPAGVRVLAIYPRNELLKDQLAEVFDQCQRFAGWIAPRGGKPLRVGVLYGETPKSAESAYEKWPRHVCPFFTCPSCNGPLAIEEKTPVLTCTQCAEKVDETRLVFTRDKLASNPPEILFTTVEMLNRHLSNPGLRHLFGVGVRAKRSPDLLLMDEVHLYQGTYGAQVGYLVRRWWAASGRRTSFVGLSATITDGQQFFASLTGLDSANVQEIKPLDSDMMEEGAEYLMAIRGDPVSQTALLSTSIQSLMLGARLLDPRQTFDKKDRPFFGWRAFAFTDQMDATNRLFRDLLDAEGRYPSGTENFAKHPNGGLAINRAPNTPSGQRYANGQDWRIPRSIGHDLQGRLEVSRTTADDSGVNSASQIVVATAALEVGYDDPGVGLVLQHKAPRDVASFLQRKGRAGRTRHMRPWTLVVLSDYGRDRMAYQSYEELFDPELPPRQLPLANRYVQRMQAVYALLDLLGDLTQTDSPLGHVWWTLSSPLRETPDDWKPREQAFKALGVAANPPMTSGQWNDLKRKVGPPTHGADKWFGQNWLKARVQQVRLLRLLADILEDRDSRLEWVTRMISERLALTSVDASVVLWEQPRPLILGAIPTAIRRLATNWRSDRGPATDHVADHPLPDFVPASLFSDLSLPELRLDLPKKARRRTSPYLPVQQGLSEFAPGKVSRRFDLPVWLGVDGPALTEIFESDEAEVHREVSLDNWYEMEAQRPFFHGSEASALVEHKGFRPIAAKLQEAAAIPGAPVLADTSNAQLIWSSHLQAPKQGRIIQPPQHIGIARLVRFIALHTHAGQSPASVRRFAIASRAELRLSRGPVIKRPRVVWDFHHEGSPAGVGFEIDTDAIVLALNLPAAPHQAIDWSNTDRARAARAARFRYEYIHDPEFVAAVPSVFIRGWLGYIFQIGAVLVAESEQLTLRAAIDGLMVPTPAQLTILRGVLETVFQMPNVVDSEDGPDRLRKTLLDHLEADPVREHLRRISGVLVDPIDSTWDLWLAKVLKMTLGAATLEAIQQACPQVDADSLVVDLDHQARTDGSLPPHAEIWISEINPGGNGLIEQVGDVLITQPDRLFRNIEAALSARDFEWVDRQLSEVVDWIGGATPEAALAESVARVRDAHSAIEAQQAFGRLRADLVRRGQSLFHSYAVALSLRLLRPASPEQLDVMLAKILEAWSAMEARYCIEIDVRVVCAAFSNDPQVDLALRALGMPLPDTNRAAWRFSVLMGILWPRGHSLRAAGLTLYNRFVDASVSSERLLLEPWLTPRSTPLDPIEEGWAEKARERLRTDSRVVVATSTSEGPAQLRSVMRELVTEPVQFDYLNVYARLAGVQRIGNRIEWTFEIAEGRA